MHQKFLSLFLACLCDVKSPELTYELEVSRVSMEIERQFNHLLADRNKPRPGFSEAELLTLFSGAQL